MAGIIDRIRNSRLFQRLMRVLQFLSAVISLGLFSSRLYKVLQLTKRANAASGAVEGILAAAVLYTIIVGLLQLCLRSKKAPKFLRWLLIVLDLLFVGAFIAVAVVTRPGKGSARGICYTTAMRKNPVNANNATCKLPLGTFALAIVSTLLHFLTAVFHEVRDHHKAKKAEAYSPDEDHREEYGMSHQNGRK